MQGHLNFLVTYIIPFFKSYMAIAFLAIFQIKIVIIFFIHNGINLLKNLQKGVK